MKAIWNGHTIAESNNTLIIEGNPYFPLDSVREEYLKPSEYRSQCPWKGDASYYSLDVNGNENPNAAWYYPDPKPAAKHVQNRIAFWHGVEFLEG